MKRAGAAACLLLLMVATACGKGNVAAPQGSSASSRDEASEGRSTTANVENPPDEAPAEAPPGEAPDEGEAGEAPQTPAERAAQILIVNLSERQRALPTSGADVFLTPEPLPDLAPLRGAAKVFIEHYLGQGRLASTNRPITADCPSAGHLYDFAYVPTGTRGGGLNLIVRYHNDFVCDAHWQRTR